jgi:hypothetical protein
MAKDDIRQVHQHPDGHHIVRVDDKVYVDTPENFKDDFGVQLPVMPIGIDERLYHQGVRHALYTKNSVVDGGPMPWPFGDNLFNKINAALNKQKKRIDDDVDARKKQVDDEAKEMEREAKRKLKKQNDDNEIIHAQAKIQLEARNSEIRDKVDRDIKEHERNKKANEEKVIAHMAAHAKEHEEKVAEGKAKRKLEEEELVRKAKARMANEKAKRAILEAKIAKLPKKI